MTALARLCTSCGETKSISEFSSQKGGKHGVRSRCKPCCSAKVSSYNKEHRAERRAYETRIFLDPSQRARKNRNAARSRAGRQSQISQANRVYREAHRDELNTYLSTWRKKNSDRIRVYTQRRRGLKAQAEGHASFEQIQARVDYYNGRCAYCGGLFEHIDHVKPLSKGGSNWPSNLRPSCFDCNVRKGAMSWRLWLKPRLAA